MLLLLRLLSVLEKVMLMVVVLVGWLAGWSFGRSVACLLVIAGSVGIHGGCVCGCCCSNFGLLLLLLLLLGCCCCFAKTDVFFASFMAFQANVKISVYDETSLSCVHFAKAT